MEPASPVLPHLLGMRPEDLAAHLRAHGEVVADAEARRIVAAAWRHGLDALPRARPVPRRVERALARLVDRTPLPVLDRVADPADGFVRYLFALRDGRGAEAVRIPLQAPGRFSVCLSSQAGCAMACAFCATGRLGLGRSLEPWEMAAQLHAVAGEAPGTVTGALFQGQGEPLANYDAVMRAAAIASHPCGARIAEKAITISTVGLAPQILRYARERRPYRLIVSLTSAVDARRRALLPLASAFPAAEVAAAVRAHQAAMGGRATVAWVMMAGVNTGTDEVEALARLFAGVPLRLNLIDVNDARADGFRPPPAAELASFRDALRRLGIPVVRRYSGGAARHAACGMLAGVGRTTASPAHS